MRLEEELNIKLDVMSVERLHEHYFKIQAEYKQRRNSIKKIGKYLRKKIKLSPKDKKYLHTNLIRIEDLLRLGDFEHASSLQLDVINNLYPEWINDEDFSKLVQN